MEVHQEWALPIGLPLSARQAYRLSQVLRHHESLSEDRRGGDTVTVIVVGLIVAILLYVASLKLSPWVICSNCKNKPKIKGSVAKYAHRVCPQCKGTGQQLRFGRKFIFGEPVPPHKR
jgi:DnaJ-class molecular chaperone